MLWRLNLEERVVAAKTTTAADVGINRLLVLWQYTSGMINMLRPVQKAVILDMLSIMNYEIMFYLIKLEFNYTIYTKLMCCLILQNWN